MAPDATDELLSRVATLLDALGPFPQDAKRDQKWRTTDQLVNELGLAPESLGLLDQVLREHEAEGLERLEAGQKPERMIRRAKYPDRTTALPLWGSTNHHGQPWRGLRVDRSDPAEDLLPSLAVPENAPQVFLSHASDDAPTALRVAESLAAMHVGSWRFETHIDHGGDIPACVRSAIAEADALAALVTRTSIVSLWVLTELHTCLHMQKSVALIVDADDPLLLRLLETARFSYPDGDFDSSVQYNTGIAQQLSQDYGRRHSGRRSDRYEAQLRDFMTTLPLYLGSVSSEGHRVWRSALAFPHAPERWSGFIKVGSLDELSGRLEKKPG